MQMLTDSPRGVSLNTGIESSPGVYFIPDIANLPHIGIERIRFMICWIFSFKFETMEQ